MRRKRKLSAGAVATMIIGFQWGGWTLGSTTAKQVKDAEQASIVRVLSPICADKFQRSADASANLEKLKNMHFGMTADAIKLFEKPMPMKVPQL